MTEQEWKPRETVQPTGGTENRIGPILSLVGGAALILGALMEWATVSTAVGTVSISSTEGGDGEVILFLGVVIVVLAGLDLARPGRFWWIGVAVAAGLALLNGVIDFFNVTENIQAEELEGGGVVSVGAGLYVALLGAAVALAGALLRERSVR
ncbi:MAG TPA: hypothetical protein VF082_12335 [Jiangellaceae bacterium]